MKYFITYDVGTSNLKTALYRIGDGNEVECAGFNQYGYPLNYEEDDEVSQHEDNWWNAACKGTRQLLDTTEVDACDIQAVTFCSQMGAVIAVDKDGNTLLPPISLIDDRAKEEFKNNFCGGILRSEKKKPFQTSGVYHPRTICPIYKQGFCMEVSLDKKTQSGCI